MHEAKHVHKTGELTPLICKYQFRLTVKKKKKNPPAPPSCNPWTRGTTWLTAPTPHGTFSADILSLFLATSSSAEQCRRLTGAAGDQMGPQQNIARLFQIGTTERKLYLSPFPKRNNQNIWGGGKGKFVSAPGGNNIWVDLRRPASKCFHD